MKYLLVILLLACFTVSCKKESLLADRIVGKWNYTLHFGSSGGPSFYYVSTDSLNQWIEFKANGRLDSNMPFFKNVQNYILIDSYS